LTIWVVCQVALTAATESAATATRSCRSNIGCKWMEKPTIGLANQNNAKSIISQFTYLNLNPLKSDKLH